MARKTGKIRVGMIRCDKRALWYGAIFDKIDPDAYAELDPPAYHHLTYYSLLELCHKRATGFRLAKVYDRDVTAAARMAAAFGGRPEVCTKLDEVSEGVDLVFIANESGDGRDHLRLATPGLDKNVPTFIERPLARSVKDAKALFRLAGRKQTPLLSCSHLRLLPHAQRFKTRFGELAGVERGVVQGHGPNMAHIADGIQLALFLFGDDFAGGVESVQSMGQGPLETVLLTYTKPRSERMLRALVVNTHCGGARLAFHATASGNFRPIHLDDLDRFIQAEGGLAVMNAIKKMLRNGKSPITENEMVEPVAVMEAARKSHNKPRAVALKTIR